MDASIERGSHGRLRPQGWRTALLSVAGALAGGLMLSYVQVCAEAVAKGERWRAEQRAVADRGLSARHHVYQP